MSLINSRVKHWLPNVSEERAGKSASGGDEIVLEKGISDSHVHESRLMKDKEVKAGKDE
jgi:hypothetical protein